MNIERIRALVEGLTAAELEAKLQMLESCFVPDEPGPHEICSDLQSVEADIQDYTKALAIRQQIEQQGISMREALRDLAQRMRRFVPPAQGQTGQDRT